MRISGVVGGIESECSAATTTATSTGLSRIAWKKARILHTRIVHAVSEQSAMNGFLVSVLEGMTAIVQPDGSALDLGCVAAARCNHANDEDKRA